MRHNNDKKKKTGIGTLLSTRDIPARCHSFLSLHLFHLLLPNGFSPSKHRLSSLSAAFFTFLLFYLFTFTSCSSIDCPVQNSVYTKYKALRSDGTPDTLQSSLTVSTTMRNGIDSILLNRKTNATVFELPISYTDAEDTLFFELADEAKTLLDTVYVAKNNTPHFESVDCNISFFHDITAVKWTNNAIDSVVINKSSVNYDASTEHFHIYFKARP
jgi:hypothetical protein